LHIPDIFRNFAAKEIHMMGNNDYIRFDWAIKRILRDKANFGVLEGLMTVLLGQPVKIVEILESESNQDSREDKYNRVDVKARMSDGEIVIVEVQLGRERHFMQRILFGVSKAVTEQLQVRKDYDNIRKVYSISVLYFDLGSGDDYVYHGKTTFRGMNNPDSVLQFTPREEAIVRDDDKRPMSPDAVYPEYFLLRVNQFNAVAKTPIEEWFEYLKDGIIKPDTVTPGLQEAREKLDYMKMTPQERHAYEDYMVSVRAAKDVYDTAVADGEAKGLAKGLAEGLAEGLAKGLAEGLAEGEAKGLAKGLAEGEAKGRENTLRDNARKMKKKGFAAEDIADITGLSIDDIEQL